jgi:hypothetical protein
LTSKRGSTAPRAMREERAASLSPVNIVRWANAAEVRGLEEESEGICAKGIRKASKLHGRDGRALRLASAEVLKTHSCGTDHVRGEKNAGILPRKKAHIAHNSRPTRTPKPRLATTPHACQSQSPTHVLVEARLRRDAVADGAMIDMVDEADENVIEAEELDVEVSLVDARREDRVPLLVLEAGEDGDGFDLDTGLLVVAVVDADRVVLTLVSVVQIATPSPFVVVVIVLSIVIPNSL